MDIPRPYLMFLGDVPDPLAAKTAHGIVDWRREACAGQLRLPGCQADLGLADLTIAEARAAGQTGVFVSGRGVAIDAVVADFISGAVEWLAPAAADGHWDLIEGQGSLFHPSYAGVSLGLLHGAQADAFVVCHEPTRRTVRGVQHAPPSIAEVIDPTVRCGRLTNPGIRPVGIAINTQALGEDEAGALLAALSREHGLPATDPMRLGVDGIVDRLLVDFPAAGPADSRHG